jgi:hypothetical protein
VEFVTVNSNLTAVDQLKNGQADLTFLVGLPALSAQIDFGPAYVEYETSFLVPANFPIRGVDDTDVPGFRIIVPEGGVAQARLSQTHKNVQLIGAPIAIGSANRVVEMLKNGGQMLIVILLTCSRSRRLTCQDGVLCLEAT